MTTLATAALAATLQLAGTTEALPEGAATPLTLEECVALALEAPSGVSIAREEERIARAGMAAARGSFLPHASLEGAYAYNSPLRGATDLQSFASLDGIDHYVGLWSITEELDTSGRLRAALRSAAAERDAARAAVRLSHSELRRAVAHAYFGALLARKLETVAPGTTSRTPGGSRIGPGSSRSRERLPGPTWSRRLRRWRSSSSSSRMRS